MVESIRIHNLAPANFQVLKQHKTKRHKPTLYAYEADKSDRDRESCRLTGLCIACMSLITHINYLAVAAPFLLPPWGKSTSSTLVL